MGEKCEIGARYVVGFMFSAELRTVLLMIKNRPDWQRGKLNGIGGRIEENETPEQAMQREFAEETNVYETGWNLFATLSDERGWIVHFFYAKGDIGKAETVTDETVIPFSLKDLGDDPAIIPNLTWLIPMALSMQRERIDHFEIVERGE